MAGRKKTETVEAEVVETAVVPAGKMEFRLINPTEDGFLRRMKPRVSSYVDRGNELIAKGKTKQAMNLVSHGLQYYSERVIDSISPYAKNDAGLIVLVLRHLADEVEKNNPGAKELAAGMEKCVGKPSLQEIERIKKPNRK